MRQRKLDWFYRLVQCDSFTRCSRTLTNFLVLLFAIGLLYGADVAWADNGQASATTPWWQVVSGIIAIPVTLLGAYYTIKQIGNMKKKKPEVDDQNGGIRVANNAVFKNSTVRGDLVGMKSSGKATPESSRRIEVLNEARIEGSEVGGDIAGTKHQPEEPEINVDQRRTDSSK